MMLTALCCSVAGLLIRFMNAPGIVLTTFGSLIAIPVSLVIYRHPVKFTRMVIFTGVVQYLMSLSFTYANQITTVANALVLQYTSGIFVLILQSIETKRLPAMYKIYVMMIVLAGTAIFFADGLGTGQLMGNMLGLLSGALLGLAFYLTAKPEIDAYSVGIMSFVVATIQGMTVLRAIPAIDSQSWLAIVAYAVIVYAISGIAYSIGIKKIDAFLADLICMLEVVLAPLWVFLLFGETISMLSLVGAVMIIGGIIYMMMKDMKEERA